MRLIVRDRAERISLWEDDAMAEHDAFDLTRLERMERRLQALEDAEAIRRFFRGAAGIFSFAIHYSLNGQIYVDGDTARAQWYLFMPCTVAEGNRAMWRASIDHEHYRRVDGSWLFSEKCSQPLMNVPFDEGWTRRRFI